MKGYDWLASSGYEEAIPACLAVTTTKTARDLKAAGWSGLDTVDSGSLTKASVEKMTAPNLPSALHFAESSDCNIQN